MNYHIQNLVVNVGSFLNKHPRKMCQEFSHFRPIQNWLYGSLILCNTKNCQSCHCNAVKGLTDITTVVMEMYNPISQSVLLIDGPDRCMVKRMI